MPSTPSHEVPIQFGARIVMGALCGAGIGAASSLLFGGLIARHYRALVIGTLGEVQPPAAGSRASFGQDRPATLIEDAVAIIAAIIIAVSSSMKTFDESSSAPPGRPRSSAARMAEKGMKVALIRTQVPRRHLRQCRRLHADERCRCASARAALARRGSNDYGVQIPGGIAIDMKRAPASRDTS